MEKTGLDAACATVGGVSQLAKILGIKPPSVAQWRKNGVPVQRVLEIERITGISRRELRPKDWHLIWPEEEAVI